jgi:hypothetical protein
MELVFECLVHVGTLHTLFCYPCIRQGEWLLQFAILQMNKRMLVVWIQFQAYLKPKLSYFNDDAFRQHGPSNEI